MNTEPESPNSPAPGTQENPAVDTPSPTPSTELTPEPKSEAEAPAAPEFTSLSPDDLQFPEGATVDEGLRTEFLDLVNNQELDPKARANGLVALSEKVLTAASEANSQAWNAMQSEWQNEVRNDPEIGGAKFDTTMGNIGKLMEEYGSTELRQALDVTGAGNNPHVVRFFNKLATQLVEVSTPMPGNPGSQQTAADRLYPSMKGK